MWNRTYGGAETEQAYSLVQTTDGGFAIAGTTYPFPLLEDSRLWVVKTDLYGNEQWNKTYGNALTDEWGATIVQTRDGGYAVAASFIFSGFDWKFYLVKTDSAGNVEWNKTYGTGQDQCLGMIQTLDGGYLLSGQEWKGPNEGGVLIKIDAEGNLEWNRTYVDSYTKLYKAIQTRDGGFAAAGVWIGGGRAWQGFLVKTDSNGIIQWHKDYGGEGMEYFYSIVQTVDGGYALGGLTGPYPGTQHAWLVKTDNFGTVQFSNTYDGSYGIVIQTGDGGYALAGGDGVHALLLKIDPAGNLQWEKSYGETGKSIFNAVVQTTDGGYALAGRYDSLNAGSYDFDFLLVKTDTEGYVPEILEPFFAFLLIVVTTAPVILLAYRLRRARFERTSIDVSAYDTTSGKE
jgi:hypothetical protein